MNPLPTIETSRPRVASTADAGGPKGADSDAAPRAPRGAETFSPAVGRATNYRDWLMGWCAPFLGDSVLEVGVGDGGFHTVLAAHRRYVGLDLDGELVERARRRNPGAEYRVGDIARPETLRGLEQSVDTVVCFNVIEHIEDDRAAVEALVDLLAPGGHLLLQVPALPALFNDLDRLAGHHRRYRRREVGSLLPRHVEAVALEYVNPLGGVGWWLNRLVRHESLASGPIERQILFFDRWVVPPSRWLTPFTRRFFGQSVMCAARKS